MEIRQFNIVGTLMKARVAGARNANHGYVAILHVGPHGGRPGYEKYIYPKHLGTLVESLRRYQRRGVPVTLEPTKASGHTTASLIDAAKEAAQPRGKLVVPKFVKVVDPFSNPKPQSVAAHPDLDHEDPAKMKQVEFRKILEARVAAFDADVKSSVTRVGSKWKELDPEAHELLERAADLDKEIARLSVDVAKVKTDIAAAKKEGKPIKGLSRLLAQKEGAVALRTARRVEAMGEVMKKPIGWRLIRLEGAHAEWAKLKADAADEEKWGKGGRKDWQTSNEAQRIQWIIQHLKGNAVKVQPVGVVQFGTGEFTKIGAAKDFPDGDGSLDPSVNPMGYLLTDGWHKTNFKAGEPINQFTDAERDALLAEFKPVGDRLLWGHVWKTARTKGWFTQFPGLAKDAEFKADLEETMLSTILKTARDYHPEFAKMKLDEGISFPMYLRATVSGELLQLFRKTLKERINDEKFVGGSYEEMVAELHEEDEKDASALYENNEHRYIDAEEYAIIKQAETILSSKLTPEQYITFASRLNLHNTKAIDPDDPSHILPGIGLKRNSEVAQDLRDRFGGTTAKWEKLVPGLYRAALRALTDERTSKLSGHEKAAVAAAFKIYAGVLGQKKSDLFTESWRRDVPLTDSIKELHTKEKLGLHLTEREKELAQRQGGTVPEAKTSGREPRLPVKVAQGALADEMAEAERKKRYGYGNMKLKRYADKPHVAFWSEPGNAGLAAALAVFPPERREWYAETTEVVDPVTGIKTKKVTGTKMVKVPAPTDPRVFSGVAGMVPPDAVRIVERRMFHLHDAVKKLEKVDAKTLRAAHDDAVDKLDAMESHVVVAKEHVEARTAWQAALSHARKYGKPDPEEPKRPELPKGVTAKDIMERAVKIGNQRITGLTSNEISTLIKWVAKQKETQKSLRVGNVVEESLTQFIHMIETYEVARAHLSP